MNVQYTAGKNIPLTDYLSHHPSTHSDESEVDQKTDRQEKRQAEEDFVINQIYGLFDFNQTVGSIERSTAPQRTDQSQRSKRTREQYRTAHSFETSLSSINLINKQRLKASMDKVNAIEMNFIFKNGAIPLKPIDYVRREIVTLNRIDCELSERGEITKTKG